jgi:radical SAM protein with 4Fe4S-binding SPASM domain
MLINSSIALTRKKDGVVLYNKSSSEMHELNNFGALILKRYYEGKEKEQIYQELSEAIHSTPPIVLKKYVEDFELQLFKKSILVRNTLKTKNVFDFVGFDLTYKCNLKCKHCYVSHSATVNELSLRNIFQIIQKISKAGTSHIEYSGGECLCRNDALKIFDITNNLKIPFSFRTNGTLITEKTAKILSRMKYLNVVHISLDGSNEKINSIIRGKGQFQSTIRGIKNLVSQNIHPRIVYTCHKHNLSDMENVIKLCIRLGIRDIYFSPIFFQGKAEKSELLLSVQQSIQMSEDINNFSDKYSREITMPSLMKSLKTFQDLGIKRVGCGLSRNNISISPNGDIFPCRRLSAYPELKIGNILEDSIKEIIKSGRFLLCRNIGVNKIKGCKVCRIKYYCGGGCRESAYKKHGDLYCTDPNCSIYKHNILNILQPNIGS